ncbi:MAG: DUF362 domain-containing protein [bacterium]|nr:DUF362 domain-containing protein [bacterium]
MDKLTRREFIIRGSSAVLGAAVGAGHLAAAETKSAEKSRVVLVQSDDALDALSKPKPHVVQKMLDAALVRFSGEPNVKAAWEKYFKPSDVVGVKMNVMMNATRPEVVRAIVIRLLDVGVKNENIITWDRDAAGIGKENIETRNRRFSYDEKTHVSKIVTEKCTALINVPGIKAHWITGIAVALKNWVGVIRGLNPPDQGATYAIHADNGTEVCMFNAMPVIRDKCRLVIVDALRPLCHAGPQVNPQYLWDYKGILVSTDPVAMDTVCARIIQEQRDKLGLGPFQPPAKHLAHADKKYRLGMSDWDNIELVRMTI